jgi:hypothetical protein
VSDERQLKIICSEVLNGFSVLNSSKYGKIYVRHFSAVDTINFNHSREDFVLRAIEQGLQTGDEKLKIIKELELWTDKQEDEILSLENYLSNLKKTKEKQVIQRQIDAFNKNIAETETKLTAIKTEKSSLIGVTAESNADLRLNELYIYRALFKDKSLSVPFFTEEEYEEIDQGDLYDLMSSYNSTIEKFNEKNLKKVSIYPFFYNLFSLSEGDVFKFYGKRILELTFYQVEVFKSAVHFKHIFSNADATIPDDVMNDPEKIMEWFNASKNAKDIVKDKDGKGVSVVGASPSDYKRLGLVEDESQVVDLFAKAKKKGGELDIGDFIKIHHGKG